MATVLNAIRVDTRCRTLRGTSHGIAVATVIVDVFQIESMDVTGEVSKDDMFSFFSNIRRNLSSSELTPRSLGGR